MSTAAWMSCGLKPEEASGIRIDAGYHQALWVWDSLPALTLRWPIFPRLFGTDESRRQDLNLEPTQYGCVALALN